MTKSIAAVGSMMLLAQAAHAAFANGDLLLGYTAAGALPNDYVIDLGAATTVVGVGGTSPVDLSSHVSQFNTIFTGGLNGLQMGAAGGINALSSTLYVSELRNGVGSPGTAGSSAPITIANTVSRTGLSDLGAMIQSLGISGGQGTSIAATDPNGSWNNKVAPAAVANSFNQDTGINPNSTATSSVILEDLYKGINSGGNLSWSYVGYLTFDDSGASPALGFTPSGTVVPEPSTYGLAAGVGLLLVSIRRQVYKKA